MRARLQLLIALLLAVCLISWWGGQRRRARMSLMSRALTRSAAEEAAAAAETSAHAPASAECAAALAQLAATAPAAEWPPPCPLPVGSPLRAAFEAAGMPLVEPNCLAQRYDGAGERVLDWSAAVVDSFCAGIADGTVVGTYEANDVVWLAAALAGLPGMRGSRGLVLGSELPWVECLALEAGAAETWTLEYSTIASTHPRLHAKPYKVMAAERIAGTLPLADWAVSYSSLEHSGLGRYGDALNPEGDREAAHHAWCMLKPGGYFVLAVPMSCAADGYIQFNAHRTYGWKRLAHIAAGFELVGFPEKCACMGQDDNNKNNNIVILRKPAEHGLPPPPLTASDFDAAAARATVLAEEAASLLGRLWVAVSGKKKPVKCLFK